MDCLNGATNYNYHLKNAQEIHLSESTCDASVSAYKAKQPQQAPQKKYGPGLHKWRYIYQERPDDLEEVELKNNLVSPEADLSWLNIFWNTVNELTELTSAKKTNRKELPFTRDHRAITFVEAGLFTVSTAKLWKRMPNRLALYPTATMGKGKGDQAHDQEEKNHAHNAHVETSVSAGAFELAKERPSPETTRCFQLVFRWANAPPNGTSMSHKRSKFARLINCQYKQP